MDGPLVDPTCNKEVETSHLSWDGFSWLAVQCFEIIKDLERMSGEQWTCVTRSKGPCYLYASPLVFAFFITWLRCLLMNFAVRMAGV